MSVIVAALHCRFLQRAVHSFDLAVGPGMVQLGELTLDVDLSASTIERMTIVVSLDGSPQSNLAHTAPLRTEERDQPQARIGRTGVTISCRPSLW